MTPHNAQLPVGHLIAALRFARHLASGRQKPIAFALLLFCLLGMAGAGLAVGQDEEKASRRLVSNNSLPSFAAMTALQAQPFELNEISPIPKGPEADTVRLANARIPFNPSSLKLAAPFFFPASAALDRARAIDCLAAAAYYEAGRGEIDERAVVQVVLNRLRHPAFPGTVCGVVFQGSDRATGCQFTFTCDGAIARRRPSQQAWAFARRIAQDALDGRIEPLVGLATHYHTDWVLPAWSPQMDKIASVNTHLFFRWRGATGEASAFTTRYTGGEARMEQLAAISPVHANGAVPPPGEAFAPLTLPQSASIAQGAQAPAGPERLPDRSHDPDADVFLVVLRAGASSDSYLLQAQQACGSRNYCKFIGWTNPTRKADQLPMPGSAINAISFAFTRYSGEKADIARWNCAEFERADRSQCLHR